MSSNSCGSTKSIDVCSILLNNDYAKSVAVPEAKQHQDGYTIYKVILQAIRVKKTIEEDPVTFVAWKRFRDLYKLHRRVVIVHAQLYLKGTVPPFPKPDFFGRLEPCVVEERRQAAQQFLSFVVQNPVLCQCEALLVFFSGAECQKLPGGNAVTLDFESSIPSSSSQPVPLSPVVAGSLPRFPLAQGSGRSLSESSDMSDDLSLHSPTEPKVSPRDNASGGSELLAAFDPFPSSSTSAGGSNYQMLSEAMVDLQVSASDDGNDRMRASIGSELFEPGASPSSERDLSPAFGNHTSKKL